MGDVVEVNMDALTEHASQVRSFMGELTAATGNAGDTWDVKAFGISCIFIAQILQLWTDTAADFIGAATDAGQLVADETTAMADTYTSNEQGCAQSFEAITNSMEERPA